MTTTKIGEWRGKAIDSEGREIVLTNESYVPELMVNLFFVTAVMEKGVTVIGGKNGIHLKKGTQKVRRNGKRTVTNNRKVEMRICHVGDSLVLT